MGTENKDHWYDGWIYDALLAPRLDGMYACAASLIPAGSRVIDIGCGTGRLCFRLAAKGCPVLGVDLSRRNIEAAGRALERARSASVFFRHADGAAVLAEGGRYDCAVFTYILHELGEAERLKLLVAAAGAADKIIVGEHRVSGNNPLLRGLVNTVEFAAGREHFRNYRNFVAGGGIRGLAARAGLRVVGEVPAPPPTSQVVVLSK